MANRTINMEVIKQIGILSKLGYAKKAIARELNLSKNTVKSYLAKSDETPVPQQNSRRETLFDFFPYVKKELGRKGVTRQILWGEYRLKHPDGYCYGHFCEHLNTWLQNKDASLHIEQLPGDKLYLDFTGYKPSIVDPDTGEIREVEAFVSVLGFSGKTYVRACESQKKEDFLQSIVHSLNYYEEFLMFWSLIILNPELTRPIVTKRILTGTFLIWAIITVWLYYLHEAINHVTRHG
jgi:transposase